MSAYDLRAQAQAARNLRPVAQGGKGQVITLTAPGVATRNPETGQFVMVGKTFKGLTDALLTWQTEELLERETHREEITVFVRPELVVEIALDGTQRSPRYPGGVALRFARVKRYRDDKSPGEADTLDAVRALLP